MSVAAPWEDAPVVEDEAEPWKSAPVVEDSAAPWEAAPIVADVPKAVSPELQAIRDNLNAKPLFRTDLTLKEAFEEPTLSIPQMNTEGSKAHQIVAGIVNPVAQMAEGISSPKGILVGGLLALGGIPAKIVGTVMGAEALKETPNVVDAVINAKGAYETTAALTNALLSTSMILPAAHTVSRGKGAVLPTDVKGEPRVAPEEVLKKDIDSEISTAVPEDAPITEAQPKATESVEAPPVEPQTQSAPAQPPPVPPKEAPPAAPPSPNDYVPALKIGDEVVEGRPGENHKAIFDRYVEKHGKDGPEFADAVEALADDKRHVFKRKELSRDELATVLGKDKPVHAEDLNEWKKATETAEPPSTPEPTAPPVQAEAARIQRSEESSAASSVEPHLRTSKAVQSILEEKPAEATAAMKGPVVPPEGGAFGSAGGRRPTVTPIGQTPRGDANWLKIPSWIKRAGRGLFTEGARGVLGRTKNAVGVELAKATRRHVDVEQELYGQHEKILSDATKGIPPKRLDAAMAEVEQYNRDVENGRTPAPLAADAKGILDAWHEVGKSTGDIARANNVQVFDAKLGAHRPMGTVKNYIPRMFSKEVESALRDPEKNGAMFNSLAQAIATHKGIPIEAAAAELNGVAGRFTANDFHGNLELARNEQLPEIFYEYDLGNLASRYLPAYSERMGQIIAYGQRLGPREAPLRPNLWDVARKESRDQETQQWLNEAEDQATGFKPKSVGGKLARRAQALGNAALLSDPTTTVVRNLLSGLSVTAERFGVGRSVRQLVEAGKTANRMNAREIGALREDIGSLLNAEQLGDSAADNFIRSLQQHALGKSGFSGSETYVRTHNALVASSFVRDAAASLVSKPKSGLSKEALAQFKRWDIDPEAIVAEKGDWKTGPETRKFIRTAVRESQGGYRFDQVPLWGGTTAGRFVYQYGRWGMQRAKDIFENTIAPAIGEKVEFRGQKMTNRNVLPLMRLGLFTAGLGEVFAGIGSALFDRDRRDSSFSEIGEAWKEDELKSVKMLSERIVNDVIMSGTLGLIGQPVDFIKSMKDQSRLKNPTEPPSLFGVKALTTLAQRAQDQGGSLTKRDWLEFAGQTARGPSNIYKAGQKVAGDPLYKAQNDVSTLRAAAKRWAKDTGQDVALRKSRGDFGKGVNAPSFEPIQDALMLGDSSKAEELADAFIKKQPNEGKARKALKSSVKGRQPFRAGTLTSPDNLEQFMEWAEKNLPPQDLKQVKRVQETYVKAAEDAGLW